MCQQQGSTVFTGLPLFIVTSGPMLSMPFFNETPKPRKRIRAASKIIHSLLFIARSLATSTLIFLFSHACFLCVQWYRQFRQQVLDQRCYQPMPSRAPRSTPPTPPITYTTRTTPRLCFVGRLNITNEHKRHWPEQK